MNDGLLTGLTFMLKPAGELPARDYVISLTKARARRSR
jgi:hypothetical protein